MSSLRLFSVGLAILGSSQLMCCAPSLPPERSKTFKFELPRKPADGEAVRARITIGTIRRGNTIVVRTTAGAIAGSISPFGPTRQGQKGAVYTIPIPREAVVGQSVTLALEVVEGSPESVVRPPTDAEIQELSLEIIVVK